MWSLTVRQRKPTYYGILHTFNVSQDVVGAVNTVAPLSLLIIFHRQETVALILFYEEGIFSFLRNGEAENGYVTNTYVP